MLAEAAGSGLVVAVLRLDVDDVSSARLELDHKIISEVSTHLADQLTLLLLGRNSGHAVVPQGQREVIV